MNGTHPKVFWAKTGARVGWTLFTKAIASLIGGLVMYWMYVPKPIEVLLVMMFIDLFLGSLEAWVSRSFSARKFWIGIMKKFIAFPMLLACDLIESPLHLDFHLDQYFAYALTVYEFISITEVYGRLGGPVPKVLMDASARARAFITTGMYEVPTLKTTEHTVGRTRQEGDTVVTEKETTVNTVVVKPEQPGA